METNSFELVQNIATVVFLVLIAGVFAFLMSLQNKLDSVRNVMLNKLDGVRDVILGRIESHDASVSASWTAFINHSEVIRAHEMRTPLTVIQAHLAMLAQQQDVPDAMRMELAQTALERAKELGRVVDKYQAEGSR